MRLTVNRSRDRDTPDFFDVVAWEGLGEACAEPLQKGRRVAVSGRVTASGRPTTASRRTATSLIAHDDEFLDARRDPAGEPQAANDSAIPF